VVDNPLKTVQIVNKLGIQIEDAIYYNFIKPKRPIPQFITDLTSITNADVATACPFPEVANSFIRFMQQHANDSVDRIDHIFLVGHNGKRFDIPFWLEQLRVYNLERVFFCDNRFGLGLDSLRLAKDGVKKQASRDIPSAYNLRELYQFVTGKDLDNAHRALSDVKATVAVLRHEAFWTCRQYNVFKFVFEEE
jgi:DNA polymerase III epsilon subunit-like protein